MNYYNFFYVNTALYFISKLPTFFRNVVLVSFIGYSTRNKESISKLTKEYTLSDYLYFGSSSMIQYLTEPYLHLGTSKVAFVIRLFLFEIILDLFHYFFHRLFHSFKGLGVHKIHHHHSTLKVLNTYYHHPIDLFFLDSVPSIIASRIIPFNKSEMNLVLVYKSFVEISGHSGKYISASCFPLCMWLPRILGIELYTHDHDLHHSRGNVNFSKRFKLWDILFKTTL